MALAPRATVVCALVLLASASTADAGPPGTWTRITGVGAPDRNAAEVGLARTSDNTLHVLWTRDKSVLNTRLSSDAKTVSGPTGVFTYAGSVNGSVQLLRDGQGGLRAFFGGLYGGHPLDSGMATATSADGVSWSVQPTLASDGRTGNRSPVYAAAGIGGTVTNAGVPVSIWGDSSPGAAGYHAGTSDQTADVHFGGSSATVAGPNAATDRQTGQVAIAWNDLDTESVLAQSIAPAGPRLAVPGAQAADPLERVAMSQRGPGGGSPDGIYLAYLQGTNQFLGRPAVWRFGAPEPLVLDSKRGARFPGVATSAGGRLWAFWARRPATAWRIYGARSNASGTQFGASVVVKPPGGTDALFSLEGDALAPGGNLDLLALIQRSGDDLGNWHQRIQPGITLLATRLGDGQVRFTTRDAGAPLATTVVFGGKSKQTGQDGKITMSAAPGRRTARATAPGYHPSSRKVKVK